MDRNITKHIKPLRMGGLPEDLRRALKEAREKRGWTQRDLASRLGLTQTHISGIESGKIVPRYDTLLELVRILDRDPPDRRSGCDGRNQRGTSLPH